MLKLKICGLTDPENILKVIKFKPDMIGFVFYQDSVRSLLNKDMNSIIKLIPSTIKKVGVFVDLDISEINAIIQTYQLDMIQLYHENIHPFQELRNSVKLIKALRIGEITDLKQTEQYEHLADYFLFDTRGDNYGGTGKKFNWQFLKEYHGSILFILSGGIGPEDASKVLELKIPMLYAIDINSKFETKPGIKNIESIKTFKNELQHENTTITN